MTYALESLPELIGERQFKMLCEALGIHEAMAEARVLKSPDFNPGEFAAKAIERRAISLRIDRQTADQQSFEGMLK